MIKPQIGHLIVNFMQMIKFTQQKTIPSHGSSPEEGVKKIPSGTGA